MSTASLQQELSSVIEEAKKKFYFILDLNEEWGFLYGCSRLSTIVSKNRNFEIDLYGDEMYVTFSGENILREKYKTTERKWFRSKEVLLESNIYKNYTRILTFLKEKEKEEKMKNHIEHLKEKLEEE